MPTTLTDGDINILLCSQLKSQLMIEEARYKAQWDMAKNYNKHMTFMIVETAEVIAELKRQINIVKTKGYKVLYGYE